jgi:hypothetical protein
MNEELSNMGKGEVVFCFEVKQKSKAIPVTGRGVL